MFSAKASTSQIPFSQIEHLQGRKRRVPCLQDRGVETLTGHTSFVSDDDSLVLEDESARMALKGNTMPPGPLVTGVVAAVRGVSAANGDFQVKVRSPLSFNPSYTMQGRKGNAMPLWPLLTGIVAGVCGVSAANGDSQVKVCSPTFVQVCSTDSHHDRQQRWFTTGIIQIWHLGDLVRTGDIKSSSIHVRAEHVSAGCLVFGSAAAAAPDQGGQRVSMWR